MPPTPEELANQTDSTVLPENSTKKVEISEEAQKATETFLKNALGRTDEPEGEKKTVAKKKEAKPAPKVEKKIEKPAEPAPAPGVDYDKIAEASARGVAQALQPKKAEEATDGKKTSPYAHLDAKEQRTLKVLEHLQTTMPEMYKDVAKKYAESLEKVAAYQTAWEKENPGKDFDPEADEHNEFFNKVEVKWEDDDYTEALADLKATEKVGKVQEQLTAQEQTKQEEQRRAALLPAVQQEQVRTKKLFLDGMGEGYEKVFGADGSINTDAEKQLMEEDPMIARFVLGQARNLEFIAAETSRLFNGLSQYNPEAPLPVHRDIVEFALDAERVMSEQAPEDQLDGQGRKFLTNAQYAAERQNKNPHLDKQFWTYTAQELNELRAVKAVKGVKEAVKQQEQALAKSAEKRGFKKGEVEAQTEEPTEEPASTEPEQVDKPLSPDTGNVSKVSSDAKSTAVADKSPAGTFLRRFIS